MNNIDIYPINYVDYIVSTKYDAKLKQLSEKKKWVMCPKTDKTSSDSYL